jgi:hypothetical protein
MRYANQLCKRQDAAQATVLRTCNEDMQPTDVRQRAKELLQSVQLKEQPDFVRVIQLEGESEYGPVVFLWALGDRD